MENLTAQLPSAEVKTEPIPQTRRWKGLRRFLKYLSPITGLLLLGQTISVPTPAWADIEEIQNRDAQTSTAYLVDVIIHKSLPQDQTEEWARDTIDNYLTRRFAEAGTNKRFETGRVFRDYDENTGCSIPGTFAVYDRCESSDGKIRVWLYQRGLRYKGILIGTSANPVSAYVNQELPLSIETEQDGYYGQRAAGNIFVHEVGHLFGLPDYYQEVVNPALNQVAPVGILPFIQDIMYDNNNYNGFSDTSRNYIDNVGRLPIGFGKPDWSLRFTPKQTILQITDNEGMPITDLEIEMFRQRYRVIGSGAIERPIPNSPSEIMYTDEEGKVDLGSYKNLFYTFEPSEHGSQMYQGSAAFLKISSGDEIRYGAITRSYLNYLYFQGHGDTALISTPFSSLLKVEDGEPIYLSAPGIMTK